MNYLALFCTQSNLLWIVFDSNALRVGGDYEFLAAVSISLGKMARKGNADYVEFEVTRGIEWIRSDKSERR